MKHSWQVYVRELLFQAQKGICPICEQPLLDGQKLAVDHNHNHKTGEIRGLLHQKCNLCVSQVEVHSRKTNYIVSQKTEARIKEYLINHPKLTFGVKV